MAKATLLLITIGVCIVYSSNYWFAMIGAWLAMPETVHRVDAIAVHGGNPARSRHATALFRNGLAPQLWHTSYPENQQSTTAAALSAGIPLTSFRWLSSTSTWTDGAQIAAIARDQNMESVLIVTDWWHSRRAVCVDKHHLRGTSITVAVSLSPSGFGPNNWWHDPDTRERVLSELVKIVYYTARYHVFPWQC